MHSQVYHTGLAQLLAYLHYRIIVKRVPQWCHLRQMPKSSYKTTRKALYLLFGGPCEVSCRRRLTNSSHDFVKIEIENNFLGFPEWDLNLGLLSARRALYQLS